MINVSGFSNEISESLQKLNDIIQKIDVPESYVDQVNKILSCEIPEYSRLVTLGIQKMDALLDGLLNIARMGTANRKIESLEMDVLRVLFRSVLLQDVLQNFEYQCAKKEVLLQAKPLPNCLGDQIQIQCVFANLVSNAIKFLRPDCQGIITITGQEKDNMAIYQVQDNGIGIPKENRDKIFSVFYQINSNSQNGQGLGLAIVKNIVNQHNGQIWVESESNKGSTFSFSIPIA
jgi:signal transduction histidine kinase